MGLQSVHDEEGGKEAGVVIVYKVAHFEIVDSPHFAGMISVADVYVAEGHLLAVSVGETVGSPLERRMPEAVETESHEDGGDFVAGIDLPASERGFVVHL